jgi:hypothetical protein
MGAIMNALIYFGAIALEIVVFMLLVGCGPTSTKLTTRTPDASLMVPCEKPQTLPAKPTGNQIGKQLVDTTKLLLDCSAKHDGLIEFENAAPK